MSGFLPDIANWALRGAAGADGANENEEGGETTSTEQATPDSNPLTEAEMRARRLARMTGGAPAPASATMEGVETTKQTAENNNEPTPMEEVVVEEESKPAAAAIKSPTPVAAVVQQAMLEKPKAPIAIQQAKKKKALSPLDPARKLQKKKELLLKKVLLLVLTGGSLSDTTGTCMTVDLGGTTNITVQTVAEILASRLSTTSYVPGNQKLIAYLGSCHKRATEELRTLKQQKEAKQFPELEEILMEIKAQSISYAASTLMVPDLFEAGKDGSTQLAKCLLSASTDIDNSITYGGTSKASSSFYYSLCEELFSQDAAAFESVIGEAAQYLVTLLATIETVLDGTEGGGLVVVSALAALCLHKKAALCLTKLPNFLLPPAESTVAQERVTPPPPTLPAGATAQQRQFFRLMQSMNRNGNNDAGYLRRSGPALEKETILGLVLRIGCPRDSSAVTSGFPGVMASMDSVEKAADSQRRQLKVYQDTCNNFMRSLVTAGAEARTQVMQWIIDAQLVNVGASAMRPDKTKVSSTPTLINMSVVLLRLCEPFMNKENEAKAALIDPGFVSSPKAHGGVYATSGDDSVPRLGENIDGDSITAYEPKNSFIPQCFFFAARSLHLGIVPLSAFHHNLLRNISHHAYMLRQRNADYHTDPNFGHLLSMQRANEVTLYLEDMISSTLRFCNLMAQFLLRVDGKDLGRMPEDFVDDICEILMFLAKAKPKFLSGHEYGSIFRVVVKLLSPEFANLVRNYNLRAKLGDVLYDLYLPSDLQDDRHSGKVPSTVATDPLSGGLTYMLSDTTAQQTLAPSLLLLYGEVEHTGYYEKMGHRAHIASLLKYLWESTEHRPAFRRITANKDSFIKFANGIMNETNSLIASIMEKLPEIRQAQVQRANGPQWTALTDEQREQISSRLEDNEEEVKRALPLCNKTLQMLGYLNTDAEIRNLFLIPSMCTRLVNMLLHVLTKLVGAKGLELKVDNPEDYNFRPKEMLRDLCAIFALFAKSPVFQSECAKSGYYNAELVTKSVKTCTKLNLLTGDSLEAFSSLPELVAEAAKNVAIDDALLVDAPEEFLDPVVLTFMEDPVLLPTSGKIVDRSTIAQHLLNDAKDPFSRKDLTIDMVEPATELKDRMTAWLTDKRAQRDAAASMDES